MKSRCLCPSGLGAVCIPFTLPGLFIILVVDESEEGAEEGEEDAVWGDAEGASAESVADEQVASSEGREETLNVPADGKEEEAEGKALMLKEAESETAGEADAKAKLPGSAQAAELDVPAGKEGSEREPGTAQQVMASGLS